MEAVKESCNEKRNPPGQNLTKSERKLKALKLYKEGKIERADVHRKAGVSRSTAWAWIEQETNKTKELAPDKKIKIWQTESVKHLQRADIVAESLMEDLANDKLTPANKNTFMANSMIAAGTAWDKSRLEAGQSVGNDVHAILIGVFDRRQPPQDVVIDVPKLNNNPDNDK